MGHQKSIESIIAELLESRNVTEEHIKKDLENIENVLSRNYFPTISFLMV